MLQSVSRTIGRRAKEDTPKRRRVLDQEVRSNSRFGSRWDQRYSTEAAPSDPASLLQKVRCQSSFRGVGICDTLSSFFCLVSLAARSLHSTKCCSLIQFASLSRSRGHPHWALTSCHTKHGSRGLERGVSVLAVDKTACQYRHNTIAALRPLPGQVHIRYLRDQEPRTKTAVCHVPLVTIRLSDSVYRKRSISIPLDL